MRLPVRTTRGIFAVSVLVWLVGILGVWRFTPVGPSESWQPPEDEAVLGFLSDDRTIVTVPRTIVTVPRPSSRELTGPIRLWDIETGRLKATWFGQQDVFEQVNLPGSHDLLHFQQRVGGTGADGPTYRLHLRDAWTGNEVASFTARCPLGGTPACVHTDDGRIVAVLTYENGEPQVACYDLTSRQLLSRLAGCRAPMCFSARGRCLAAVHGTSLAVFDVRIGRQIAMLDSPEAGIASPMEFSPDESLLLDSHGNVWNLPSGTRRFGISQLSQSCTFTPDGLKLVGVVASGSESWLAYYDVFTGKEQLDRRVSLVNGEDPRMGIHKTRPGGRWLIAVGGAHIEKPPVWEMWIAKLKSFRSWAEGRFVLTSVVVETATGQEIAHSTGSWRSCTSDGRFALSRSGRGVDQLWDVPPRRLLHRFFLVAAAWSVTILVTSWLAYRRIALPTLELS